MHADDRVFWLDLYDSGTDAGAHVLCRRHADSMLVPGGWTLDDRRDPDLHLFRPPAAAAAEPKKSQRRPRVDDGTEQLTFGGEADAVETATDDLDVWTPTFDTADDLNGLLSAKSPLLSRAFRGDGRPRRR